MCFTAVLQPARITAICWTLHRNNSTLMLSQSFGRAELVTSSVLLSPCRPKKAALPQLRSSGYETSGITKQDCSDYQRFSRLHPFSPATELGQRNTWHSQTAFGNMRSLGLFLCRSIYSLKWCCRQKAKWSTVSKSMSLKMPPESQEHTHPPDWCKRSLRIWRKEILCYGDHGSPAQLLQAPSSERLSEGLTTVFSTKEDSFGKAGITASWEGSLPENRRLL